MATTTTTDETNHPDPAESQRDSTRFADGILVGVTAIYAFGAWGFTALLYGVHPFIVLEATHSFSVISPLADAIGGSLLGTALFAYAVITV